MSDHAWALENVAAYLADGLEAAERERLEAHAADCPACAQALGAARDLDTELSNLLAPARPAADLEDRLLRRLGTATPPAPRRVRPWGWPAMAAAAVLLLGMTGAFVNEFLAGNLPFGPRLEASNRLRDLGALEVEAEHGSLAFRQEAEQARRRAEAAYGRGGIPGGLGGGLGFAGGIAGGQPQSGLGAGWDERHPPAVTTTDPGDVPSSEKTPPVSPGEPLTDGTRVPQTPKPPAGAEGKKGPDQNVPGYPVNDSDSQGGQPGKGKGDKAGQDKGQPPPSREYFNLSHLYDLMGPKGDPKDKDDKQGGSKNSGAPDKKPAPEKPLAEDRDGDKPGRKEGGAPEAKPGRPAADAPTPTTKRVIIRSGDIEFEVESFDVAVATITRLVTATRGGFIATVNSDKLPNGKVKGSVVVRVPPEQLDNLLLDLRKDLTKNGELKGQRIASSDITKQYTDLESRLKAARAMEERLLGIIKSGKGEIKDLLAVERELGTWRTQIEELEGQVRYYANLAALSTLTITLYEKEVQAPAVVQESEKVQMGLEVEDVDLALRAAQAAVREVKGRVTRSEMKQHSAGQYSALLYFEVGPDSAGPVRDRLKQLGTVARMEINRTEEAHDGTGKPKDAKVQRTEAQFQVSFYNLTNVAPRETVQVSLAAADAEDAYKALLAKVEKLGGRVLSSTFNRPAADQAQGVVELEVKSAASEDVLAAVKEAGEVLRLQVVENPDTANTTRKKRGFRVQFWSLASVKARETRVIKLAARDVQAGYRSVQETVARVKGRVLNAQLDERDPHNVGATVDFEAPRSQEAAVQTALATVGEVYSRNATRAAEGENVSDSKVRWQLALIDPTQVPPRETYQFGVEASDVDQSAATLTAFVAERQGRVIDSNVSRDASGRVTGHVVFEVPLAKAHELLDRVKALGKVRSQQATKKPEVPEGPLAVARVDVTLSNAELILPSDDGFWPKIRKGLTTSFTAMSWSLTVVIIGVCFVLPWAVVLYGLYRLIQRQRKKAAPATPAA